MKFISTFCLFLSLTSAALAGFDTVEIKTTLRGEYVLGLVVSDQRETVLKWGALETLIGAHHSGMFRNRKDMFTESGDPVSVELLDGLRKDFTKKWLSVAPFAARPWDTRSDIDEKIRMAKLKRSYLLTLKSLWVEAQRSNETTVSYSFVVSILDENAVVLASKDFEGIQSSNQWGYWGAAEVFSMLIANSLENQKIRDALLK